MKLMKIIPLLTLVIAYDASATVACNGLGQCGTTNGIVSGVMGNFDIANDTGQPAYGFEIDYENAHSAEVGFTWDWSRFGAPTIGEYVDSKGVSHAVVRYESPKDASGNYTQHTIPATFPWTTGGHQCTSSTTDTGCEHFVTGMFGSTTAQPTVVTYNWLVDNGSGKLVYGQGIGQPSTGATMAPPILQAPAPVQPPAGQPAPAQPAAVQMVPMQPAPAEKAPKAPTQWGDPVWLKVVKTTTHGKKIGKNAADVVNALVDEDKDHNGKADWQNDQESQVESEWYLIQQAPDGTNGAPQQEHIGAAEQVGADETVTRKYEWYDNVAPGGPNGSYDGETHEQMCDAVAADGIHGSQTAVTITDPNGDPYPFDCSKVAIVGNYLAGNMVAFENVMPLTQLEKIADIKVNTAMAKRSTIFGGNSPYKVTTTGHLPDGLIVDATNGIISGNPTVAGEYTFDINVVDTDNNASTHTYTVNILDANGQKIAPIPANPLQINTSALANGTEGVAYPVTAIDVSGGSAPYVITLDPASVLPIGMTFNGASISGTPVAPDNVNGTQGSSGTYSLTFNVVDSKGATTSTLLALTIDTPACSGDSEKILGFTQLRGTDPAFTTATNGVRYATAVMTINPGAQFAVGNLATYQGSRDPSGVFCVAKTITINPAPVTPVAISTTALPNGTEKAAYSQQLAATDGIAPYAWSTTSALPSGITLSSAGLLSGTPVFGSAGTYPLSLTVTDASNKSTSAVLSLVVDPAPDFSLAVTPTSLSVKRGSSVKGNVQITPLKGFTGAVALAIAGLPANTSAKFGSISSGISTLTISTTRKTARGTFHPVITATSQSLVHTIPVTLVVK
ncbi:MAG: putative Ig domain-containing protein [Methylobacter sp.]